MKSSAVPRLSIMMFLQFFAWGAWFATMGAALDVAGIGGLTGDAYASAPIAAIFAPLFLGLVADRLFNSERVMGVLMLVGGVLLVGAAMLGSSAIATNSQIEALKDAAVSSTEIEDKAEEVGDVEGSDGVASKSEAVVAANPEITRLEGARQQTGTYMVWLILAHLLCYMPTLGLSNTIAFTHTPTQEDFPKIRVWGTIGWIAAGLGVGFLGWSNSLNIFWLGAGSSILLGLFCFTLPATPPPLKGKPIDVRSVLMVDAFKLFADANFLIFAICSTLICIPLAYYYGSTATFLNQTGFEQAAATMTIGQMSEIVFMLLIPFFFRRLGLKMMIMIGMGCWVLRYVLFAYGASELNTTALLVAVALHGICYDFFFVTGFMYTDQKAPKAVRGQAQGLLVFLTQGVGMYFGYKIMAAGDIFGRPIMSGGKRLGVPVESVKYVTNLGAARGDGDVTFGESLSQMVVREIPQEVDQELLASTMTQWHDFWLAPAVMAAGVFVVFGIAFWDKAKAPEADQELATAGAESSDDA